MLAPIPYLDFAGYRRRTEIEPGDIDLFESRRPGFIAHRIAILSSKINARLQKRYDVPLGKAAPALIASGTLSPLVTLTGRPTLGSLEMNLRISLAGILGVATFDWSQDGGETWTLGVLTSALVVLGSTGLTANFPPVVPYSLDNAYAASTPVPEIALGWLVAILDVNVWRARGTNPQDPAIVMFTDASTEALAEMTEAANSNVGLFDLPTNDALGDSAIEHGGPRYYTETSPFVSADIQERHGVREDCRGFGAYGGEPDQGFRFWDWEH